MSAAAVHIEALDIWYSQLQALRQVHLELPAGQVVAFIGPSGCGKSTLLRALNRLLDEDPRARVAGRVLLDGQDIYTPGTDLQALRRRVGLLHSRPNPFPLGIAENVGWALRLARLPPSEVEGRVEAALRRVGLWAEVSGRLGAPARGLDPGQQQRLCLARTLALGPQVLLLDEVTAQLDPVATARLEELLAELRGEHTVVIVTHNIQQASRVSDRTAFFLHGELVETDTTATLFTRPRRRQTEHYITGRYG